MMRIRFYTLGCKLNQAETETLADAFRRAGAVLATDDQDPNIFILNSCT
ncbi:MAG TPA: tRNA (N(6)-L-threonylcarbamoyladenosine(37)-C(2))-methylthiotransferase MtaB, partial [Spirochaetia bacterium]|nr:tRNA (N(6)-L-threonylcarbamoyladenosine(37)-C(2))-methylthiotransferase MtaB [Spirochaetia bacterium]